MAEMLTQLLEDTDGMGTYEYIVNNVGSCLDEMPRLIDNLRRCDVTGQFFASTARFLAAVDRETFEPYMTPLIEGAIDKDREHRYIGALLDALWGADYMEHAEELCRKDDNFRRIYKRMYPAGI